jgi:hypothetical protein
VRHPNNMWELLSYVDSHPGVRRLNAMWTRNERFQAHVADEGLDSTEWERSREARVAALRYAPY